MIFGLPRSRTFWLSRFLSYGGWECGHDQARYLRSPDDIKAWLSIPAQGTAETAAAPFWRTLRAIAPQARVVLVRRPPDEVIASMGRLGIAFDPASLATVVRSLDAKLDQIAARWPGALSVRYADLATEATCAAVFEHCLPFRHDPAWWRALAPLNLQINMPALMRVMAAFMPQLTKLAAILRQQTLMTFHTRPVVPPEGVTIQAESFASFFADPSAQKLFRGHLAAIGEHPFTASDKNIPLMQGMDAMGAMQLMTARSNGRVFGYLMTFIGPCWEDEVRTTAANGWFYADPAFPGIGMKLQRAALAGLKARGVDELYMRAGPRGAGLRTGALYRRLGAIPDGELFRLAI